MRSFSLRDAVNGFLLLGLMVGCAPDRVAPKAETGEITGTLQLAIADDFVRGTSRTVYRVIPTDDAIVSPIELPADLATQFTSGEQVGWSPDRGQLRRLMPRAPQLGALRQPLVTGDRHLLVMIVDFNDSSVSCTEAEVADSAFGTTGSAAQMFAESSFGLVNFPADTDNDGSPDVVRVSINKRASGQCRYSQWAGLADSAAAAQGIDLSLYEHKYYMLPDEANCNWTGLGDVACGNNCRAWQRVCEVTITIGHEIGHNLGLRHAGSDFEDDGAVDFSYGDLSCQMGFSRDVHHFNALHKAHLGWIPPSRIQEVSTNGTYQIASTEVDPSPANTPQMLVVPTPDGSSYVLSFRDAVGLDSDLGDDSWLATVAAGGTTHRGFHVWNADETVAAGVQGGLVDGGLCASAGNWAGKVVVCEAAAGGGSGSAHHFHLTKDLSGQIAVVEASGAVAAVFYNDAGSDETFVGISGTVTNAAPSALPAITVSRSAGLALLSGLPMSGTVTSAVGDFVGRTSVHRDRGINEVSSQIRELADGESFAASSLAVSFTQVSHGAGVASVAVNFAAAVCGDGTCDPGEDCSSCAGDCGACPICGDGTCDANEDCASCTGDCGACAICGDGTCDANEDCASCAGDCGACSFCGDGTCDANEDCGSCSADCGACPACGGNKAPCSANADCCSNNCGGNGKCKGN